jgi:hypothetical protein
VPEAWSTADASAAQATLSLVRRRDDGFGLSLVQGRDGLVRFVSARALRPEHFRAPDGSSEAAAAATTAAAAAGPRAPSRGDVLVSATIGSAHAGGAPLSTLWLHEVCRVSCVIEMVRRGAHRRCNHEVVQGGDSRSMRLNSALAPLGD